MKKIAGTQMHMWKIYRQNTPVFVGKDKLGEAVYRSDFECMGEVMARTIDDAFIGGKEYCTNPVLEYVGVGHVH